MFGKKCSIIGVVHVPALPGSAGYEGNMEQILASALSDALTYKEEGIDAVLIENMHDAPYLKGRVESETTAAMAVICNAIKYETVLPVGVQILAAANLEALAVAVSAGLDFIRVEGFVYAHIGDEGWHESCAAHLVRKRSVLKAEKVKIFADIKKKHSAHSITSDVSLLETARDAEFFRADGVVITGVSTSRAADVQEVKAVSAAVSCSVLVGSGVTAENVRSFTPFCDALIVGSSFKMNGNWTNEVDPKRVRDLIASASK
jgi:membrane complex biogenesis BtpA family protein